MRFSGVIPAKLDVKGRVFLPSVFRKQLCDAEGELVLKRDPYQPCLTVYPARVWEREVDTLAHRLNRWNPREAMVFRRFLAEAETFTLDAAGRFLLPRHLADAAGIGREVVFLGVDDRIEVWSRERMNTPLLPDDEYADALSALMSAPVE